jgi:hypothetical protein
MDGDGDAALDEISAFKHEHERILSPYQWFSLSSVRWDANCRHNRSANGTMHFWFAGSRFAEKAAHLDLERPDNPFHRGECIERRLSCLESRSSRCERLA